MPHVLITSTFNAPFERVRSLVLRSETMVIVSKPVIVFAPVSLSHLPEQWEDGKTYRVKIRLFDVIPIGWYEIRIQLVENGKDRFIGKDKGRGLITPAWEHTVTIERSGTKTIYSDAVDIQAGLLTPFVVLFAKAIYARRQRRWKKVVLKTKLI